MGQPDEKNWFIQTWLAVCEELRARLGEQKFQTWIAPIEIASATPERAELAFATYFSRDAVLERFGELITTLIQRRSAIKTVAFVVEPKPRPVAASADSAATPAVAPVPVPGSIPLDANRRFAAFVRGPSNDVAFEQAHLVATASGSAPNPLFLFGPTGVGKSHLANALAWTVLEEGPSKRVLYMTAEWFTRAFVSAVQGKDTLNFKDLVRNVDLLICDDVQFFVGKDKTLDEFFHTFDDLVANGKQVVLTADRSPSSIGQLPERLRSRLLAGGSVEIQAPDADLRFRILQAKAERMMRERPGFAITPDVLRMMAHRIATNARELEGALHCVLIRSGSGTNAITVARAQEWLADFLRAHDRKVTIDEIKKRVAERYRVTVADLESPSRQRAIVRPRQIAMYMCRTLTPRSFPEIGHRFGDRDHTTIIHGCEKIRDLMRLDPEFAAEIESVRLSIRNWPSGSMH